MQIICPLVLCLTLSLFGCTHSPKPNNTIGIVRVAEVFTTLNDNVKDMQGKAFLSGNFPSNHVQSVTTPRGTYYYTKLSSGAAVLSPDTVLLSDHQTQWSRDRSEGYFYLPDHGGLHHAKRIARQTDPDIKPAESTSKRTAIGFGWEILRLDTPIESIPPIRLVKHPEHLYGKTCYVPISVNSFLSESNGNPPNYLSRHHRDGDRLFIRSELLNPENVDLESQVFVTGNKVAVYFSSRAVLHGASGYPLLIYDKKLQEWLSLGVIVGGDGDPKTAHYVWAMRPTKEQLFEAGLDPDKIFAPCSSCESED